jgi:dihydroorotate dehydrogenase (fumarate)
MSVDLTTRYLGLELKNPLVASSSPLTGTLENLQRLEEVGTSAVVLPSLFEEQIEHDEYEVFRLYEYQTESFAESLSHFPEVSDDAAGPQAYLDRLERAKKTLSIPVIASLNGSSEGGWTRYAQAMQDAGADALELNIYFVPTEPDMTADQVEKRYCDLVSSVKQAVSIPLSVKIGQNFTALPSFAQALVAAGADGLVLFNRYLEADIDLDTLSIKPDLVLSNRHEARVPLRWIAILRDQLPELSLGATSGVHRMQGVLKLLLAGADVTMVASVLLKNGPEHMTTLIDDVRNWLEENEYASVEQLKGSMSRGNCPDPSSLERANYTKALVQFASNFQ